MNTFVAEVKTSKLIWGIFWCIVAGPFVAWLVYGGLDRFTAMNGSTLMTVFFLVAVPLTAVMVWGVLSASIRRVELDAQALRITMLLGKTKVFPLQQHRFSSELTHQTHRGNYTGTIRTLKVHSPTGEESFNLDIEPSDYSELVNRLTGQVPLGGVAPRPMGPGQGVQAFGPQFAGQPGLAGPAGQRRPLSFQPRRFEISRKPVDRLRITFGALGVLFLLAGIGFAILLAMDSEPEAALVVGIIFGLLGLILVLPWFFLTRRVAKVPRTVTVAPTWVAFDDRGFNYTDLRVIQIKPPGEVFNRSAKVLTASGEQVVFPLGLDRHVTMFPEYDTFAAMLNEAGTAAAGVVRIDYS